MVRLNERLALLVLAVCLALPLLSQQADVVARPAVIVPANADQAVATVHFTGVQPVAADITLGVLANDQKPNQRILPSFEVGAITGSNQDWDAPITFHDLMSFGDNAVPVLLKRQPNQTLHFQKVGLVAKASADSGFAVREGSQLFVILENPTAFDYPNGSSPHALPER
jgi:hypothetical protein